VKKNRIAAASSNTNRSAEAGCKLCDSYDVLSGHDFCHAVTRLIRYSFTL